MKLVLFDIDGTLTLSGQQIKPEMDEILSQLYQRPNTILGLVGGSNIERIKMQMKNSMKYFKYVFAECGSVVCVDDKLVCEKNILDYVDRTSLNVIIKQALRLISDMPIMHSGCQIDFRKSMIYISPPGMQAVEYERNIFIELDKTLNLRKNFLETLKKFDENNLFEMTLGGAVGVAVYPVGWNKNQVVDYLINSGIQYQIYYFGDKTEPNGNDYPIYINPLINGFSVENYEDTMLQIQSLFL